MQIYSIELVPLSSLVFGILVSEVHRPAYMNLYKEVFVYHTKGQSHDCDAILNVRWWGKKSLQEKECMYSGVFGIRRCFIMVLLVQP